MEFHLYFKELIQKLLFVFIFNKFEASMMTQHKVDIYILHLNYKLFSINCKTQTPHKLKQKRNYFQIVSDGTSIMEVGFFFLRVFKFHDVLDVETSFNVKERTI